MIDNKPPAVYIYEQIKEIFSLVSDEKKTLWDDDPIIGSKKALLEIKNLLQGKKKTTQFLIHHDHSGYEQSCLKILNLYLNGAKINLQTIDNIETTDILDHGLIDMNTATSDELFYLKQIIKALFSDENDKNDKVLSLSRNFAQNFNNKKKRLQKAPNKDNIAKNENNCDLFVFNAVVDDILENGINLSQEEIRRFANFFTNNNVIAKSDDILDTILYIIGKTHGKDAQKEILYDCKKPISKI